MCLCVRRKKATRAVSLLCVSSSLLLGQGTAIFAAGLPNNVQPPANEVTPVPSETSNPPDDGVTTVTSRDSTSELMTKEQYIERYVANKKITLKSGKENKQYDAKLPIFVSANELATKETLFRLHPTLLFSSTYGQRTFLTVSFANNAPVRRVVVTDGNGMVKVPTTGLANGNVYADNLLPSQVSRKIPRKVVEDRWVDMAPELLPTTKDAIRDRVAFVFGVSTQQFSQEVRQESDVTKSFALTRQQTEQPATTEEKTTAYFVGLNYVLNPLISVSYGAAIIPFPNNKTSVRGMFGVTIDLSKITGLKL